MSLTRTETRKESRTSRNGQEFNKIYQAVGIKKLRSIFYKIPLDIFRQIPYFRINEELRRGANQQLHEILAARQTGSAPEGLAFCVQKRPDRGQNRPLIIYYIYNYMICINIFLTKLNLKYSFNPLLDSELIKCFYYYIYNIYYSSRIYQKIFCILVLQ